MTGKTSSMASEIAEIPDAARRLAAPHSQALFQALGAELRASDPGLVLTVARGSSDHASLYLKYAFELALGLPVASVGPSVASVYGASLKVPNALALAISQSGASTDLIALGDTLREGGARLVVLTNTPDSPLGRSGDPAIDICAGPETAVAATKSFVNSILAGLWVIAHWSEDKALADSLASLPDDLAQALDADTAVLEHVLGDRDDVTMIARGPALGLAQEAALKTREVLARHSDGFSAAEVLHGPSALIAEGHSVLIFGASDEPGIAEGAGRIAAQGARVLRMSDQVPAPSRPHMLTSALPQIAAFYAAVERVAQARGLDPDRPRFLAKKTVTR